MTERELIEALVGKLKEIAERNSWLNAHEAFPKPFDGSGSWMSGYNIAAHTRAQRAKEGLAIWEAYRRATVG